MKVAIFSTKSYDRQFFTVANVQYHHELTFLEPRLNRQTALLATDAIAQMKPHAMLINTSRGALIDTDAIITALKSAQIGALGLDVYEQESELFFEDLSDQILQDDTFARLMTFPNVMITGHQAFFTEEAMQAIAEVTLSNIRQIEQGQTCDNEI